MIINYHPLVIIYSFPEHEEQNACLEKKIVNGKTKASTFLTLSFTVADLELSQKY